MELSNEHLPNVQLDVRQMLAKALAEILRRVGLHAEGFNFRAAVTPDLIGQAKRWCYRVKRTRRSAFGMLRTRSSHENRKVTEIAQENVKPGGGSKRPYQAS